VTALVSWPTLTASVLSTPVATFFNWTGAAALPVPNVTVSFAALSYAIASDSPVFGSSRPPLLSESASVPMRWSVAFSESSSLLTCVFVVFSESPSVVT
jgi:hypothetical protein